jgi:hypothetical protein
MPLAGANLSVFDVARTDDFKDLKARLSTLAMPLYAIA